MLMFQGNRANTSFMPGWTNNVGSSLKRSKKIEKCIFLFITCIIHPRAPQPQHFLVKLTVVFFLKRKFHFLFTKSIILFKRSSFSSFHSIVLFFEQFRNHFNMYRKEALFMRMNFVFYVL